MKSNCSKNTPVQIGSRATRGLGLLLIGVVVAGCPAQKDAGTATVSTAGKIVIKGSNTIGEELEPALVAEYKKTHPGAAFDMESKATGYGIANLLAGKCDIAAASRETIKEEAEEARTRNVELNNYVIGAYSVAVIVNKANPVSDLTRQQVRDIFTGVIQNWKDVGGPDAAVHLYVRDPISGTYLGFRELAMENKSYGPSPAMSTNYEGIVQGVAQDANGIGYSNIYLANREGVKGMSIGGVAPSADAVKKGKYPYSRTLRFYTHKGAESSDTQDFIKFVLSSKGQEIVAQMGDVPAP